MTSSFRAVKLSKSIWNHHLVTEGYCLRAYQGCLTWPSDWLVCEFYPILVLNGARRNTQLQTKHIKLGTFCIENSYIHPTHTWKPWNIFVYISIWNCWTPQATTNLRSSTLVSCPHCRQNCTLILYLYDATPPRGHICVYIQRLLHTKIRLWMEFIR